jgi:hypothetical protein
MPVSADAAPLPIVDALTLPEAHRRLLRPGEPATPGGPRLPRFFYRIESWSQALETPLAAHFGLWEFIDVDLHEPAPLRMFPRYVPCAVALLATALEVFRVEAGVPVRIAANGGYRSPSHARSSPTSAHAWGAAANVYRVGGDMMDSQGRIERYADVVRRLLPFAWVRPYGESPGSTIDHLHIEIGFAVLRPSLARHGA